MNQAALAHWLASQKWSDFALSLADYYMRHGALTERQEASARSMHAKVTARKQNAPAKSANPEPGYYIDDKNDYYVVVEGKRSGNLYAKMWNGRSWDYVGRSPFATLVDTPKLSKEQAAEFGHMFGRCIVCGRTLTDPASVEAGIGPICAKRL